MKGVGGREQNKNYLIQFYHLKEHKPKSKAIDKMLFAFSSVLTISSTLFGQRTRTFLKQEIGVVRTQSTHVVVNIFLNIFNLHFQIYFKIFGFGIPSCVYPKLYFDPVLNEPIFCLFLPLTSSVPHGKGDIWGNM